MERGKGEVLELTPTTSLRNCPWEMNGIVMRVASSKILFFIMLLFLLLDVVSTQIYAFFSI